MENRKQQMPTPKRHIFKGISIIFWFIVASVYLLFCAKGMSIFIYCVLIAIAITGLGLWIGIRTIRKRK